MNVVIPMAGAGSRFANKGYKNPKPLIEVFGKPMIKLVVDNLTPVDNHQFIFICQEAHVKIFNLETQFKLWVPNCRIITVNGVTDGAARTVLHARNFIDNDESLMIANSDQFIDHSIDDYLKTMNHNLLDGLIMTMSANDPKWSFVECDNQGMVRRVVEKEVISDEATVGIYNFAKGSDFVWAANSMIEKNIRVNGEFYVAPAYNELINIGKKIGIYNIGSVGCGMHGLGTPEDLNDFLDNPRIKDLFEKA